MDVKDKLGRELKDLRVSVIDACNFRCTYCMPAEIFDHFTFLKKDEVLSFEEILRIVRHFVTLGVTKIRLTGGEPLLRKDLDQLVASLTNISGIEDIALTTNGYLLAEKAQALKDAGLNRVTVSLDTLDPETFKQMSGRDVDINRVLQGIEKAQAVGLGPLKINVVVQRGVNDKDIFPIADRFKGTGITVRYIEYMDVGSTDGWHWDSVVPADEIVSIINAKYPLEAVLEEGHEVAKRYRYVDGDGEIGVISSVSKPFCGSCVRARLSADGKLYTCLFATNGTDLRGVIRAGIEENELYEMIRNIWQKRGDKYSEIRHSLSIKDIRNLKKVEMFRVGG